MGTHRICRNIYRATRVVHHLPLSNMVCIYIYIYMSRSVGIHGGHPRKQRLTTGTKGPWYGAPCLSPPPCLTANWRNLPLANWRILTAARAPIRFPPLPLPISFPRRPVPPSPPARQLAAPLPPTGLAPAHHPGLSPARAETRPPAATIRAQWPVAAYGGGLLGHR